MAAKDRIGSASSAAPTSRKRICCGRSSVETAAAGGLALLVGAGGAAGVVAGDVFWAREGDVASTARRARSGARARRDDRKLTPRKLSGKRPAAPSGAAGRGFRAPFALGAGGRRRGGRCPIPPRSRPKRD